MSHLRIVRDEPPKPRRRRGLRPPPVLSEEQDRLAKASIRRLALARYGSVVKLGIALGLHRTSLHNALGAKARLSGDTLLRVALATRTPVEAMITPGSREVTS